MSASDLHLSLDAIIEKKNRLQRQSKRRGGDARGSRGGGSGRGRVVRRSENATPRGAPRRSQSSSQPRGETRGGRGGRGGNRSSSTTRRNTPSGAPQRGGRFVQSRSAHRSTKPYARGDVEGTWSHDLYDGPPSRAAPGNRLSENGEKKKFSTRPAAVSSSSSERISGNKVRITGLDYDITDEELEDLLAEFGDLHSANVLFDRSGRSTGEANAVFRTDVAAQKCVDEMDEAEVNGKVVSVNIVGSEPVRGGNSGVLNAAGSIRGRGATQMRRGNMLLQANRRAIADRVGDV